MVQARFTLNGREFICFDSPIKHQFTFTPAMSLLVECRSEAEVDRLFAALSAGGRVLMPLDSYPFSKRFGWLCRQVWRLLATTPLPMRPRNGGLNASAWVSDCLAAPGGQRTGCLLKRDFGEASKLSRV